MQGVDPGVIPEEDGLLNWFRSVRLRGLANEKERSYIGSILMPVEIANHIYDDLEDRDSDENFYPEEKDCIMKKC